MDEILLVELNEHASYPVFVPPVTDSVTGYVLPDAIPGRDTPAEVKKLLPGNYNITIKRTEYRVLVADRNGARYFLLFDMGRHHFQEMEFLLQMSIFALFMTIISSAGGFWLAGRVTAPVTRLAEQVGNAEPKDVIMPLTMLTGNDEVAGLARAFARYHLRLKEFIQREKYFKADVSHELRTPLAIMRGTVEVLEQDESLSAKQREQISRIRRAVQDMTELTAALLLMAHEYQHTAEEPPCNIAEVTLACVEKHQHLIGDRPIRMEVELIAEPHLNVERPLLEIVIGNLIRNALFNTESGNILLRLEAGQLIVSDTGVGMHPDVLARALDRYYKGASSAGEGVGLSLVKRICERYGWRITLDSQQGKGTTARVIFSSKQ